MTECIVCDIDGTIANNDHRRHHLLPSKKDWESFNAGMADDTVHEPVLRLLKMAEEAGIFIIMMTGREQQYALITTNWFIKHGVPYNLLLMRSTGDHRPDTEIKSELLNKYVLFGYYEPLFFIDDRDSVVKMWRELGHTCFQCAEGDF